ncbi:MAG: dihydroneopterin triphosphate diphosphatase, partial [Gammaproteobacteria bacterium]|nr:dihydroneopterin triphosphate diphosphatase [Gammaproteobacteria bacterium]
MPPDRGPEHGGRDAAARAAHKTAQAPGKKRRRGDVIWKDARGRATLSSRPAKKYKRPESVLVVVYSRTGKVLLLRRADDPGFWQSVTGSLLWEETDPRQAAVRELREETGLGPSGLQETGQENHYTILPQWRHRYAPEVRENTEHVYFLALPAECEIDLNSAEHTEFG